MPPSYENQVAIVTGAASERHWALVMVADLNEENGKRVVEELNAGKPRPVAAFHRTDISSWDSLLSLFSAARRTFSPHPISIVVTNAAIPQLPPVFPDRFLLPAAFPEEKLRKGGPEVIDVGLVGTLYTVQLAVHAFRVADPPVRGRIVVTGSDASLYPFPMDPLYATTKSGVLGLVRALAPRLENEGTTINALGPAVVPTGLPPDDMLKYMDKRNWITPLDTVVRAAIGFIEGEETDEPSCRSVARMRQIAECFLEKVVYRPHTPYLEPDAKEVMRYFWDLDGLGDKLV